MAGRWAKKARRNLPTSRALPCPGDWIRTSDILNSIVRVKVTVDSVSKATVGTPKAMARSGAAGVCALAQCIPLSAFVPASYGKTFIALASKRNPTPSTPGGKRNGPLPAPKTLAPGSHSTNPRMAVGVGAGGHSMALKESGCHVCGWQPDGTTCNEEHGQERWARGHLWKFRRSAEGQTGPQQAVGQVE
jgi:hypothetical protein